MERRHGRPVVVGGERAQHADRGVRLARAVAQQRPRDLHAQIARAEQRAARAAAPPPPARARPARDVGRDGRESGARRRVGLRRQIEHERRRALSGADERGAAAGAGLRSAKAPSTATATTRTPATATGRARFLSMRAATRAG